MDFRDYLMWTAFYFPSHEGSRICIYGDLIVYFPSHEGSRIGIYGDLIVFSAMASEIRTGPYYKC